MKPFRISISVIIISVAVLLALGFGGGYFWGKAVNKPVVKYPLEVRENTSQYQFINPLLLVNTDKSLYVQQFKPLVGSLTAYLQSAESAGQAQNVSIYFRDMNTGHWTGIGENDLYRPSSMLKVLTMVATAQLIENNTISLDQTLAYDPAGTNSQYYKPSQVLSKGDQSIQALVNNMIMYSDNSAADALLTDPDINNEFSALYKLFHFPMATSSTIDFMSPKSYATVWRALYNGTLLSDQSSENVLNLLSHTDFNVGLVAGVPVGTTVAHKFGEFTLNTASGALVERELHDCGIVYFPNDPYFLCVMTRGNDFSDLANTIAGVSKITYQFVASTRANQ